MAVQALSRRSLLAGAVSGFAAPARAQPVVSTALVLAADISSSMNRERFELQRKGYADTFTDAQVIRAIRDTAHGCIGVCYVEWAGGDSQRVLVPWTLVRSVEDGERIAAVLGRAPRPFDGSTNLGAAISFATRLLAESPFVTTERVIDISGDGVATVDDGRPDAARDRAVALGIRINGLAIDNGYPLFPDEPTLTEYYERYVRGGDRSFVIEANDYETFGAALVSKVRREIA
jgi:hypothetical protein